jgi:DNA-binding NarL/FixJ family response regulator
MISVERESDVSLTGPSILIADDHYPTRERLGIRLSEAGFAVQLAPDAEGAVRLAVENRPDLCLLDIKMPGGGIAAARRIHQLAPATIIVMLTVSRDDDDLFDALQAGASGYVLKDVPLASIPALLRRALAGEALLSGQLASRLVNEFRERGRRKRIVAGQMQGDVDLSRREWQVLELLAKHLTTAEIAQRLFLEPVTVRTHIARILRKLRVPTREAALRLLAEQQAGPQTW